ncbi:hypothetical protein [Piscinibacter terrae]|uniref:Uncharacterized protein n=1 Tax=Piscinibacter terrae TaxID=2496871 RepID=A0A3N7IS43_9BURK|nr:hypothetical protein [Albitalea terrae]RQP21682.1 hypothetical protein DZC73_27670 [Albitalea terrae]
MTRIHRKTTDERLYLAAEDVFSAEGGRLPPVPPELETQMAELRVTCDGPGFEYNGYHYDRLADAMAYSRLMRSRPEQQDTPGPYRRGRPAAASSGSDRELMNAWGIALRDGRYQVDGFHYDNLSDAVRQAQAARAREEDGGRT